MQNEPTDRDETSFPHLTQTIQKQILSIRNSGETNMFDRSTVQSIAYREGYYELVNYIAEYPAEYTTLILRGKPKA